MERTGPSGLRCNEGRLTGLTYSIIEQKLSDNTASIFRERVRLLFKYEVPAPDHT